MWYRYTIWLITDANKTYVPMRTDIIRRTAEIQIPLSAVQV